ncbi:MAG: hypothetical protein M5U28_13960 [Sandaracinaceae bacterium]|nr:hypothetical protein [Sandaracinaceae bacterium]
MPNLPTTTLIDLAILVVAVADAAWVGTKKALVRLRPYVEPPADVEVRSTIGATYTGVLLIDKNEIIAGIVVRTGHRPPPMESGDRYRSPSLTSSWSSRSPLVTPSSHSRFDDDDEDCKLPSWAEDPRDTEEDRWRR